jgi:hypothetical protein
MRIDMNTFITGTDRWHVEKMMEQDFFWHAHPFENSSSKGFILPDIKLKKSPGIPIIIDLAEVKEIDISLLDLEKTVFYCEQWNHSSAFYATAAKNIIAFEDGIPLKIKENHRML